MPQLSPCRLAIIRKSCLLFLLIALHYVAHRASAETYNRSGPRVCSQRSVKTSAPSIATPSRSASLASPHPSACYPIRTKKVSSSISMLTNDF